MSKTTVDTLVSDIKALADYDITDSSLDSIILKGINFGIKRMKQWFLDEGMYDEIGAHDTFNTTADQEYVDIATETVDFDQNIVLSERNNDYTIEIISFKEYRERYPDPTADKASTFDAAAFFANRLYLGPTPDSVVTLYLDYVKLISKVSSGGTLPYEDKYDELLVAIAMEHLTRWMDKNNINAIREAKEQTLILKKELIVGAAKNIGLNQQTHSREPEMPYFAPRKVI